MSVLSVGCPSLSPPCENTTRRHLSESQEVFSQESNHAGILISDFQTPELKEMPVVDSTQSVVLC